MTRNGVSFTPNPKPRDSRVLTAVGYLLVSVFCAFLISLMVLGCVAIWRVIL